MSGGRLSVLSRHDGTQFSILPRCYPHLPDARPEGGKELILGEDSLAGERVHEARLSRIGISDDADRLEIPTFARCSVESAGAFVLLEFFEDSVFFFFEMPLHDLGVGFSDTGGPDPSSLP